MKSTTQMHDETEDIQKHIIYRNKQIQKKTSAYRIQSR